MKASVRIFVAVLALFVCASFGYGQMNKADANKATVKKFFEEVVNKHNADAADQFIAKDAMNHQAMPGSKPGVEGIKEEFRQFFKSFPDLSVTVDDLMADGDKIIARVTYKGTNKGMMGAVAATNKTAQWGLIDIILFKDGKMQERWGYGDNIGMMIQLGLMPAPQGGMDKK